MRKMALVVILAMSCGACLTFNPNYKLGTQAELNKKWDEAIRFYEKASLENPKEPVYRLALVRARLGASLYHLQEARRLIAQGKKEEAKAEYAKALSYNPRDTSIALEARTLTAEGAKEQEAKKEKLEFPIKLKAKEEKVELKFLAETSLKSILLSLGKSAGINILFDENFREIAFATELSNVSFEEALRTICYATRNFYRIVDERTVVVIPDLPMKRMQYEASVIKTFYLSNIKAESLLASLTQLLMSQTGASQLRLYPDKDLNTVTVRSTPQVVELAEKLIRIWDKPKGEVVIDLEIMEVSRLKLRQLGINFDQNIIGLRYGEVTEEASTSWFNLKGIDFSKAESFSVSLPTAYVQFLESDSNTKIVAQPRLRGVSDEEISHKVGQKIPIPRTSFSPLIAGGVNQQPITSIEQQDVGIEIKIKPRVHFEKEITLELDIKVTSLGGTGYADVPIINNREIKNVMRLKDGETNLIAGLLRDEERKSIKGIPGLKDIPVLGRLFGVEDTVLEQTDVILTITPYIIRSIPVTPEDLKAIWVDVESVTAEQSGRGGIGDEIADSTRGISTIMNPLTGRQPQTGGVNQVSIFPTDLNIPVNREFQAVVNVNSQQEIGNISLVLNFDSRLMNLKDVIEGGMIRQLGDKIPFLKNINNSAGICTIGFSSPQTGKGIKGSGSLVTLLFESKSSGEGLISISSCSAGSPSGQTISLQTQASRIIIR